MPPQVHHQYYMPHNPYTTLPPHPPPPVAHKVWILDCKSCGTFLTNRGMKAVLLLRPNVALYSSDAQPANCSPWSPPPEDKSRSGRQRSSPSAGRTCECLTQTLCCHGCGNSVGYMIVVPCARCTSSIATSNRSTNGHRFVFHSNEIASVERRYIPGENGVKPYEPVHYASPSWTARTFEYAPYSPSQEIRASSWHSAPQQRPPVYMQIPSERTTPPSRPAEHDFPEDGDDIHPPISGHHPIHQLEYKEHPLPRRLQAGECLYWHNLSRGREILGVQNDERARRPRTPESGPNDLGFDR